LNSCDWEQLQTPANVERDREEDKDGEKIREKELGFVKIRKR